MNTEKNSLKHAESKALAEKIVTVLMEKGALDIKLCYVRASSSVTDYYINCTGKSSTQVCALADEVSYQTGLLDRNPEHTEGRDGRAWILVDYGDVIVNVFDRQSREFYNLDRMFPEDSLVDVSHLEKMVDEKFNIDIIKN